MVKRESWCPGVRTRCIWGTILTPESGSGGTGSVAGALKNCRLERARKCGFFGRAACLEELVWGSETVEGRVPCHGRARKKCWLGSSKCLDEVLVRAWKNELLVITLLNGGIYLDSTNRN